MRNFVLSHRLICLFFLSGLLLALSCRYANEPTPAPPSPKIVQVAKDDHGFDLLLDNAVVQPNGCFDFYFRVKRSFASEFLGNYADTLNCANFTLLEDDELISEDESAFSVTRISENYHMYVLLLLDMSGSVVPQNLNNLKLAAKRFVDRLFVARDSFDKEPLQIQLSIYYFDGRADIIQLISFTADTARLQATIRGIDSTLTADRSTNLYGAVIQGMNIIKGRVDKKDKLISAGSLVIFTDGTDRAGRRTKQEAIAAVEDTTFALHTLVSTYTIGLGDEIDKATLIRLAKDGFVLAESVDKLVPSFESIANRILLDARSPYRVQYCSPLRDGKEHLLLVRAHTKDHLYYGSRTFRFTAVFEGGGTLKSSCPPE
jgi:hypothetical protein